MIRSLATLSIVVGVAVGLAQAQTSQISVDSSGNEGFSSAEVPSVSSDGRYVAFRSYSSNLVNGDSKGHLDVFLRDRQLGVTTRVSVRTNDVQGNAPSDEPAIAAEGGFVAFTSQAANLVGGDTNGTIDVFVRDLQAGATTRISVDSAGTQCTGSCFRPAVSGDGRFIAFESVAVELVSGDTNSASDIFVHDRQTGATMRVSVDSAGAQAAGSSFWPSISADGQFVAFRSVAPNLVPGDTNSASDIFVHDRLAGATTRVSIDSAGLQGTSQSFSPSISADGRSIAFFSHASNLVGGDTNGMADVFVHDRVLASTVRASVDNAGVQGNGTSSEACISGSGRLVAFASTASNLVPDDLNDASDCFVRDLLTGRTSRVSLGSDSSEANGPSSLPSIAHSGAYVVFQSDATNLVFWDGNDATDVFIRKWLYTYFLDADGDGYGDLASPLELQPSPPPPGYSGSSADCNDSNAAIQPGAPEQCNSTDDNCDGVADEGFGESYCTSGTTVHGCVPQIAGEGAPSSTATSGFDIVVSQLDGQRYGTMFYGFYPAAVQWAPFSPSFKCVASPVTRTGVLDSGGTAGQCDGELRVDFNAWMRANPGAIGSPFVAGQVFHAEGWFRDPGAPKQTNLSNGLRFTLCE